MNTEISGVILQIILMLVLSYPLGKYIAKVYKGEKTGQSEKGQEQMVSQGPTTAIIPIKQLGTNGGGYYGVNSSHPLENPTYLTNIAECWSICRL